MSETITRTVQGSLAAGEVARLLVAEHSQWVAIEPLPDDFFEITVKAENASLIERIIGA